MVTTEIDAKLRPAKPFIKMAGGKRMLAPAIVRLIPKDGWSTYIEPFLGGGALFFELKKEGLLKGKTVVMADVDADLVELWRAVKEDPIPFS